MAGSRAELIERLAEFAEEGEAAGVVYGGPDDGASLADVFTDSDETVRFLALLVSKGDLLRIGRLWVRGATVPWDVLFEPVGRVRVPLPPHPFRPTRYWLRGARRAPEALDPTSRPSASRASDGTDEAAWYVRATWRETTAPVDARARTDGVVIIALTGGAWRPRDPAVAVVRDEKEALRRAAEAAPGGVIVLDGRRLDADACDEDPLRLPLALARACATDGRSVTYVGLYLPEATDPMGACVSAFVRSAAQEVPGFRGIRIEVADAGDIPGIGSLLAVVNGAASEVRFAAGRHHVRSLEPLEAPAGSAVPWRERGVYLITGGAGGVGRLFAERLARTHRASLILLGRGPVRPATEQLVATIEDAGGQALYVSADVCDRDALASAVASGEERFGPLNGVVHAAGAVEDATLRTKTDASIGRVLAPKTTGTRLLDEVTADRALDFFCLMSSVHGTIGNAGQCDYAAANRYLDAYALWRHARVASGERHGLSVSVAWPHWTDGGMAAPPAALALTQTTTGLRPMRTATGLRALDDVLASGPGCTIVGVGDRERFISAFAGTQPNVPEPVASTPDAAPVGAPAVEWLPHRVLDRLLDIAAPVLRAPRSEIDPAAEMGTYGFNSVLLTEFCQQINVAFGTALTPVVFFEHPTLTKLAAALARNDTVVRALAQVPSSPPEKSPPPPEPEVSARAPLAVDSSVPCDPSSADGPEPVAIVGMSGRFPGAPDLETYWSQLTTGHDAVREVDPERWDWRVADAGESCRYGGFLDDVDAFDAAFFGISPREARTMDPQQRLFLETSWSALEHAGYDPRSLAGSHTGVFTGVTLHDWLDVLRRHGEPSAAHTVTGNVHSIVPNRVSYLLDLRGPSEALDTACSSSLAALHRAVGALRSGECDLALAGGVNVLLSTDVYDSLARAGMLSPTGHCHAFGDAADGYVRGEGVGAVVLKPLSRALADGDTVHAVILGTAVGHGGRGHSLTAPSPSAQADVVVEAVRAAGVPAGSISFIETHGTGTALGDPIEVSGLKEAFARLGVDGSAPGGCALGAVKSAIGHLESAAGIASLVKVVLAMRYRTLPPNLHCDPPNRHLELADSPFRLVDAAEPWKPPAGADGTPPPLRAGVSSFGFGGSNAHVVLEEPPLTSAPVLEEYTAHAVVLSAHDSRRLREYARQLRGSLAGPDGADLPALADLAYTTHVGRPHLSIRVALVADSLEELRDRLDRFLTVGSGPGVCAGDLAGTDATVAPAAPDPRTADAYALAAAWAAGARIDWDAVHADRPRRRVPLPTYPFDRTQRHRPATVWPRRPEDDDQAAGEHPHDLGLARPTAADPVAAAPAPQSTRPATSRHPVLLERRWTPLPDSAKHPRRQLTCLLMVRGHESLGLIGGLEPGIEWIVLRERSDLPRLLRQHEYELDFDDYADGEATAAAVLHRHPHIDTVLDLVDVPDRIDLAEGERESGLGREAGRVALLQALVRHATGSDLRVVHVTRGLADHRNPRPGVIGARMAALVRTLGSEYSAVRATTLDVERDTGLADTLPLAVREIATADEEPEVCLRGGVRYAPRLADLPMSPDTAPLPGTFGGFDVDADRVYVITGGTGGLGAALACELFARGARRFALLGRRPCLRPRHGWPTAPIAKRRAAYGP
ncbi:hypothetical protein SVIO_103620 [Streptomyces violaceusniger]|uniref:Uncharacterized protein n=1 Tax=Streptomyces violaceusniger TaxID=68280 RepID=A0A4D4LPE7_STRVO|nr:hypothetical protein SVIO_103620 [Streptomyces violaceusniger]